MIGRDLKGRKVAGLAGAVMLLLALTLLLIGPVVPALAVDVEPPPDAPPPSDDDHEPPPLLPHGFAGVARFVNRTDPVLEGTAVDAFVNGVKKGETSVRTDGRYAIAVGGGPDDAGKTVTFTVGGALANETASWQSGTESRSFDLTIKGSGSDKPAFPLPCFIATAAYGTDTAEEIDVLREFRDAVLLPNRVGAAVVWLYYEVSPPLAGVIARHEFLRAALRSGFIDPMVAMLKWSHNLWLEGRP